MEVCYESMLLAWIHWAVCQCLLGETWL